MAARNQPWGILNTRTRAGGDEVWVGRIRIPMEDGTGRKETNRVLGRVWDRTGRPPEGYLTRAQAKARLDEIVGESWVRPYREPSKVTFEEVARDWLVECEKGPGGGLKPSTLHDYRSVVEERLLPRFGQLVASEISGRDVAAWMRGLNGTVRPRTINKYRANLHAIFNHGVRAFGLEKNPVSGVKTVRDTREKQICIYSLDEARLLIANAPTPRDAAVIAVAVFSGLRIGEIRALHWGDIDFAAGKIRVNRAFSKGVLGSPKGGRMRAVPLLPELADILARHKSDALDSSDTAFVFRGERGGILDEAVVRVRFARAARDAGLRKFRFHDLRHTFGSIAIRRAPLDAVSHWMGHADLKTTMIYLHYVEAPEDVRQLASAFESASLVAQVQAAGRVETARPN